MPEPVYLRVYDLSDGAVRVWSPVVLGKRIEGIWHTGIVLYGMEYFYGGGIVKLKPSEVQDLYKLVPHRVHQLGITKRTQKDFESYLVSIKPNFTTECYDLIRWNCNNFTDHASRFLLERGIPAYILELPEEITNTFMGKIVINFIKMFSDGSAIDCDAANHPKQTLALPPSFSRTGRRGSCPGAVRQRRRSSSVGVDKIDIAPPVTNFHPSTQEEEEAVLRKTKNDLAQKPPIPRERGRPNRRFSSCSPPTPKEHPESKRARSSERCNPTTKGAKTRMKNGTKNEKVRARRTSAPVINLESRISRSCNDPAKADSSSKEILINS